MKWIKRIVIAVVLLVVVTVAGIYATGNESRVKMLAGIAFGKPDKPFDPGDAVAAPDYSETSNWAALPNRDDLADLVPAGVADEGVQGSAPVDVFFIHPTGFLKGSSWTFSMDPDTSTEENTSWMMANQASAYNGCCNVYAPRYRQASIFSYFSDDEVRDEVLAFAYQDVARAFDYFLEHYNQGRPFIIAGHSQGTQHGATLLKEKIDGTPVAQRMVAAYIIGGSIKKSHFADMRDVAICTSATDLHCAVHWDTWSEATINEPNEPYQGNLCVNPLSWELDGGLAGTENHKGAVPASGKYHLAYYGDDSARGVEFGPLGAPVKNLVHAQCSNGILYSSDQTETPFGANNPIGGNYHGLDYPIFHMDIRENAKLRVAAYLAQ
jgi:hypothetical protein